MKLRDYVHHKGLLALGTFSKLIEVVLELFVPIFMGIMLDEGVGKQNSKTTYFMLILIGIFSLLGYLSTVFAHFLVARVSQDYAHQLRLALFDKVIDFDHENRSKFSSSSLLNRLNNDVLQTSNALAMTMRIASRAPFLMIGSIVALLITAHKIAVVFMLVLPIVLVLVLFIVMMLIRNNHQLQIENDRMSVIVKENIDGIQSIQAFVQSDYELNRFNKKQSTIVKLQRKLSNISSLGSPLVSAILNVSLVLMIYMAGISINIGDMTQGQVISMINYTTNLILSVLGIFNLMLLYARTITANARIRAVLTLENKENSNELLKDKIKEIEFKNVSYHYPDQSDFLKNVSFTVKENEIIGILGLTGSGKSTILKLVNRLIEPVDGTVLFNRIDYKNYSKESIKEKVGFIDQKNMLLMGTVRSNLSMNKTYKDEALMEALKLAAFELPQSELDREVLKDGANFSGGQRQRLNIARALIRKPDVIIMDDSLASLDNHTQNTIKNNVKKLAQKPIIFIAASRLNTLAIADRIMVVKNGLVEAIGTMEELKETSNTFNKIYQSQVEIAEVK
ncbi:ABC transporter ATP-binding protein [Acholeplasma hippikon]|uniref:ABC-type multidrug/protein/lipid transport system ATPase component n=1 Tax=Acholeplasma hippikon TaxID=264636 RepID=A0A449BKA4_9MOLU|nr:ABC transporter ATP-binding protein [Acholeplasma hippikon]VEU82896.1 ABC-type multidrug/protein/lipid transport system ATPase component [Acholeplasma hippikon]